MDKNTDLVLEGLKPLHEGRIMDLVQAAGIDVSGWAVKADGAPVQNPRANPNYCYEWAFGGGQEPGLACIWHASLQAQDGQIVYEDNIRAFALKLDRIANENRNPRVKSRARDQARRARAVDSLLQRAFRAGSAVRVIVLDGDERDESELGWDSSRVHFRSLDSTSWFVHAYDDESGKVRMVRGLPPPARSEGAGDSGFVDQFSVPKPPEKLPTSGTAYPRSSEVRASVLRRAKGVCELCLTPGFKTASGAIYLETHHVVPLSEAGCDEEWNVVALCANDHRQAHFSERRAEIQTQLLATLISLYPGVDVTLRAVVERSRKVLA